MQWCLGKSGGKGKIRAGIGFAAYFQELRYGADQDPVLAVYISANGVAPLRQRHLRHFRLAQIHETLQSFSFY